MIPSLLFCPDTNFLCHLTDPVFAAMFSVLYSFIEIFVITGSISSSAKSSISGLLVMICHCWSWFALSSFRLFLSFQPSFLAFRCFRQSYAILLSATGASSSSSSSNSALSPYNLTVSTRVKSRLSTPKIDFASITTRL